MSKEIMNMFSNVKDGHVLDNTIDEDNGGYIVPVKYMFLFEIDKAKSNYNSAIKDGLRNNKECITKHNINYVGKMINIKRKIFESYEHYKKRLLSRNEYV